MSSDLSPEQVPSPDQRVNDALAAMKLPREMPGLAQFLKVSLFASNLYSNDAGLAMRWDDMVRTDLENIVRGVRTAQEHCQPHALSGGELSEAFYCAVAMLDLPANGRVGVHILQGGNIPEIRKPVVKGHYIHSAFAALNDQKLCSLDAFEKLTPEAKLLTELFATEACVRVMTAKVAGANAAMHISAVNRYRGIMLPSQSAMGKRFQQLAARITGITTAPVRPAAPDPVPAAAAEAATTPSEFDAPNVVRLFPNASKRAGVLRPA